MANRMTAGATALALVLLVPLFASAALGPSSAQTSQTGPGGGSSGRSGNEGQSHDPHERTLPRPSCRFPEVLLPNGSCGCAEGYINFQGMCSLPPPRVRALDPEPAPAARPRRTATQPAAPERRPVRPPPVVGPAPKPNAVAGFSLPGRPCLDPDLHALLVETYGEKPELDACTAACLPRPPASLLSRVRQDELAETADIAWCPDDCIALSGYLPASEILELERLTGRTFCMTDGAALCNVPGFAAVPSMASTERLEAILSTRSVAPPRSGDLALVIGNGDYDADWPDKAHGLRDAGAIRKLLVEKLGFDEKDIIFYENANDRDFDDFLGPGGWIDERGPIESLFVYVSAHGLADPDTGAAYILPVDALPEDVEGTSVPLEELYAAIARIGARSTTLMLEVDFVTDPADLVEPPNLPDAQVTVLPKTPVSGLSVFTAADRDQRALADPELGTGLFTRHLIEGLAGGADEAPIGNGDRRVEAIELYVYTAHRVRTSARKGFGLEQKPLLGQTGNMLIGSF